MTMRRVAVILIIASVSGMCSQMHDASSSCSAMYENHNQVDYGPLKVREIRGVSDLEIRGQRQEAIPVGACFVLFTENGHQLVTSGKSDADGRFQLKQVPPGRYRLIARADGLCVANIPLEVVSSHRRRSDQIVVHFRAAGVDSCSSGELSSKRK
jgi:hypothetical protein